jgi:hypothetical protein
LKEAPHSVLKALQREQEFIQVEEAYGSMSCCLDQQLLDLSLESQNLRLEVRSFVSGDGASNDWAGHTASTAKSSLGGNENVWDVLVFAQER